MAILYSMDHQAQTHWYFLLRVSFRREFPVNSRTRVEIRLIAENKALGEVVVVGYGQQTKATLTGAISSVKSAQVLTTKNESVVNMLTGKLAGVRIVQKSS